MRFSVLILALVLVTGCASVHQGNFATSIDGDDTGPENKSKTTALGLMVSGAEDSSLSSKYFGHIQLTFENKSNHWVHIKKVTVQFEDESVNQKTVIPVGGDLTSWAEAAQNAKAIRDYNTSLLLSSVAAVGGAAMSRGGTTGQVGALALIGSGTALTVKGVMDIKSDIELAKVVPSSHLLSPEFIIPPGLATKKWVTFFTSEPLSLPYLEEIKISYITAEGKSEKLLLKFRDKARTGSQWQANHPVYKQNQPKDPMSRP